MRRLEFGIALASALGLSSVACAEPAPVLIEAYGRSIGPVLAPGVVLMTIRGRVYRLAFHEAGFDADAPRALYYESADCSGTAYFGDTLSPPLAYVVSDPQVPGQRLSAPGAPLVLHQIGSTAIAGRTPAPCMAFTSQMSVAPILDLPWGPGFAEPFTVQLR